MASNLEDDKLQLGDIIWMHPILGCLTHEVLLTASCRAISFDRITSCPNLIIELRQFDDERIVIIAEERFCLEPGGEDRFEVPRREFLEILQPSSRYVR